MLELTDEQVESIVTILEEHDAKLQKLASKSSAPSETPLVVIRPKDSRKSMMADVEKKILDVLTESQREEFEQLLGRSFVLPADGPLPTLIEPSEKDETKTLKELAPDK